MTEINWEFEKLESFVCGLRGGFSTRINLELGKSNCGLVDDYEAYHIFIGWWLFAKCLCVIYVDDVW